MTLVQAAADAERVYVGVLEEAFALDAGTGAVRWRRPFDGPGWIGTRLRALALSPEGDLLVSLDALYPPRNSIFSAAVIIALDPATGEERWRYTDGGPTTDKRMTGLTLWEGLMLYTDGHGQEVVAVERATRAVRWRAATTPGYLGPSRAPVVADGVAYFSDGGGGVFAVDAATGALRWSTTGRGGAWSHEVCGRYFLLLKGPVDVVDRGSGRSVGWLFRENDDTASQTAVADGVAYVSARSGVYAFDCRR